MARDIGKRLAEKAIWYEDRCNWIGVRPSGNSSAGFGETVVALGADLYGGTSGIALFLAELHAITGDGAVRRTALGAIRQASSHIEDTSGRIGSGLYDGRLGIALAAARVGTLLRRDRLLEWAADHVHSPLDPDTDDPGSDLISGRAGSILALLVLSDLLDDQSLINEAARLGDELLEAARKDGPCYTWSPTYQASMRPLTGFAHGAAGIGCALLELFDHTDDARYRRAADSAFAYERGLFDPDTQTWPDLRHQHARRRRWVTRETTTQWCHGAAGISLSRLRAYQLVSDEICREEAVAGIANTRTMVTDNLTRPSANYSLCHGLAGDAEVLLHAAEILGSGWAEERTLAIRVADEGIERFATTARPWPCGARNGLTPNLMAGLAGIGHFYLRLHDPTIPSVLLIRREG